MFGGAAPDCLNCCIAYTNDGGFCLPLSGLHRPAAQKILSGLAWERETIAFMVAHCGGKDIVHAGTFFGDFLPRLSVACGSQLVWAFEPNRESFRCAEITCLINDLRNVRLHNAGLGESRHHGTMMVKDHRGVSLGGESRIVAEDESVTGDQSQSVSIVCLDEAIPKDRTIGIIQLDVEGYEKLALAGALEIIERDRPLLILETVAEAEWMAGHILSLGYRQIDSINGNSIFQCDHHDARSQ